VDLVACFKAVMNVLTVKIINRNSWLTVMIINEKAG